jgi:hypothetical protein
MGNPKTLRKAGNSILFKLKGSGPLHAKVYMPGRPGLLRPGFFFPCQFCHVELLGIDSSTGIRTYLTTYIPAPLDSSSGRCPQVPVGLSLTSTNYDEVGS